MSQPPTPDAPKAFTGRRRNRSTTWAVKLADIGARVMICAGGGATIVAVLGVCVFLVWVVLPLFYPAKVGKPVTFPLVTPAITLTQGQDDATIIAQGMDDYQLVTWVMDNRGRVDAYWNADGTYLGSHQAIPQGATIASAVRSDDGNQWMLGLSDGKAYRGTLGVSSRLVDVTELPADYRHFTHLQTTTWRDGDETGLIQRVNDDQFRILSVASHLDEPLQLVEQGGIAHLDFTLSGSWIIVAVMTTEGRLLLEQVTQRRHMLTGKVTQTKEEWTLPFDVTQYGQPAHLLISGLGDAVYLAWRNGRVQRYNARHPDEAYLAEEQDLVPEPGEQLTALTMLLGRGTLVSGDSLGRVRAWFRTSPPDAGTPDGATLTLAHELKSLDSAIVTLGKSSRSRLIAAGSASGQVQLMQATSHKLLANLKPDVKAPVDDVVLGAKDDGLLIFRDGKAIWHPLDVGHPETTWRSLFFPVWYENFNAPETTWQSSGATDDFESKYGLWPLVFGSLKATVYCLLFGVPLALLGAVYTSEFLHPRAKAVVKPTIEMMASLPSVVLGFLAALVIAPVAEQVVPGTLASFVTIPLAFLAGAMIWQLLPYELTLRLAPWRLIFVTCFLPVGLIAAYIAGPPLEAVLFADKPWGVIAGWVGLGDGATPGDIKAWLDGQMGLGEAGWLVILLPLAAILTAMVGTRWVNPWLRDLTGDWSRRGMAVLSIVKVLVGMVVSVTLALTAGLLLTYGLGWDPRGSLVDTYVQRNALVVGFVMGFAIIPLIYTIAEDALSAVPDHLRAASLGAGATPWQTAMRIVMPTAMSGLFSAVMIGIGRAVGETMIVLMAAGNTAVTDWNPFNGFRTLSANIAVELPEAVENSTHYRTLYLAALVLFVITFLLNTVAETIRLRFRKRAFQL